MLAKARGRRAIGYVRVASVSQADPRSALEAQAAHVQAIAKAEGVELIGIVEDSGQSALDMSRQGLEKVLGAASEHGIEVLIVADVARLARDPEDLRRVLDSLTSNGVVVIYGADYLT